MDRNSKIVLIVVSVLLLLFLLLVGCGAASYLYVRNSSEAREIDGKEEDQSALEDKDDEEDTDSVDSDIPISEFLEDATEEKILIEERGYLHFMLPPGWTYEFEAGEPGGTHFLTIRSADKSVSAVNGVYVFDYSSVSPAEIRQIVEGSGQSFIDEYNPIETRFDLYTYNGTSAIGHYTTLFTDRELVGVDPLPEDQFRYIFFGGLRVLNDSTTGNNFDTVYIDIAALTNYTDSDELLTLYEIYNAITFEVVE